MLHRTVETLASLTDEVLVIGPQNLEIRVPYGIVIPDDPPDSGGDWPGRGVGPLGAIATALRHMQADRAVIVSCDLPLLNGELLLFLVAQLQDQDAVVPVAGGRTEQLHAVYHRRCLSQIEGLLRTGETAVHQLLRRLQVRYINEPELRGIDPDLHSFLNVNTPADWLEVQRLLPAAEGLRTED